MADLLLRDCNPDELRRAIVSDVMRELLPRLERLSVTVVPNDRDRLRTVRELATDLGVSEATISRWTRESDIPVIRRGRVVRYSLPDVRLSLSQKGTGNG